MFETTHNHAAIYETPNPQERIVVGPSNARYKKQASDYVAEFVKLVETWRSATAHLSLIDDKVRHPAFKRIVKIGLPAIPLIIDELRFQPDHLYIALRFITKEDPTLTQGAKTTSDVVDAWLAWADRNKQYAD